MEEFDKNRLKKIVMFLLSLLVAAGLTFLLKEPGFTDSQVYVLFLLFFAIGLWLTEAIPAFAVSLLIIALSASSTMFLPVSSPPNAMAYSTGLLEQKDFRIGGVVIGLLGPLLAILWVLLIT